ncbi:MAG: hypothetical protein HYW14_04200 [Planctomycetes bacterium]|nr:hypothetical protein [Planctomycetota bacterium]
MRRPICRTKLISASKRKKKEPEKGSPEAILKHMGTWKFEKGELDNILKDIQKLREIED